MDKRRFNRGRPSKITKQDRRSIIRSLKKLRETEGSFTSPRIALESGVAQKVHNRTIRMVLNQEGYYYRRSRKKGLLKRADLHARKAFCQTISVPLCHLFPFNSFILTDSYQEEPLGYSVFAEPNYLFIQHIYIAAYLAIMFLASYHIAEGN